MKSIVDYADPKKTKKNPPAKIIDFNADDAGNELIKAIKSVKPYSKKERNEMKQLMDNHFTFKIDKD